jgi:hypothetical protein
MRFYAGPNRGMFDELAKKPDLPPYETDMFGTFMPTS